MTNLKVLNTNEEIPDIFFVFLPTSDDNNSLNNYNNYLLDKTIRSSGYTTFTEIYPQKKNDYINGNIKYVPFEACKMDDGVVSSHMLHIVNSYAVEYEFERYRPKTFPSRFSCIFAFGDYESCYEAAEKYNQRFNISNIKRFKLYIPEDEKKKECIKVVKCNMNIISLMWNNNIEEFSLEERRKIIDSYWNAEKDVSIEIFDMKTKKRIKKYSNCIYEYLIEGILVEVDENGEMI